MGSQLAALVGALSVQEVPVVNGRKRPLYIKTVDYGFYRRVPDNMGYELGSVDEAGAFSLGDELRKEALVRIHEAVKHVDLQPLPNGVAIGLLCHVDGVLPLPSVQLAFADQLALTQVVPSLSNLLRAGNLKELLFELELDQRSDSHLEEVVEFKNFKDRLIPKFHRQRALTALHPSARNAQLLENLKIQLRKVMCARFDDLKELLEELFVDEFLEDQMSSKLMASSIPAGASTTGASSS